MIAVVIWRRVLQRPQSYDVAPSGCLSFLSQCILCGHTTRAHSYGCNAIHTCTHIHTHMLTQMLKQAIICRMYQNGCETCNPFGVSMRIKKRWKLLQGKVESRSERLPSSLNKVAFLGQPTSRNLCLILGATNW